MTETILIVCTANICRSPFVERVLQAALDPAPHSASRVTVTSAGTRARAGARPPEIVGELIAAHGGDPVGLESTLLTAEQVAGATLVLTATREHRAAAVRLHRSGLRTAFTMRQFARLLEGLVLPDGPGRHVAPDLARLVSAAAQRRGSLAPAGDMDDVLDPIGGSRELYQQAADQMLPVVDALAAALARP